MCRMHHSVKRLSVDYSSHEAWVAFLVVRATLYWENELSLTVRLVYGFYCEHSPSSTKTLFGSILTFSRLLAIPTARRSNRDYISCTYCRLRCMLGLDQGTLHTFTTVCCFSVFLRSCFDSTSHDSHSWSCGKPSIGCCWGRRWHSIGEFDVCGPFRGPT